MAISNIATDAFPGTYCGTRTREIDGALLLSSSNALYANNACVIKFVTDDDALFNRKKFMIIFRTFQITDCSVKLSVYYDRSSFGAADVSIVERWMMAEVPCNILMLGCFMFLILAALIKLIRVMALLN